MKEYLVLREGREAAHIWATSLQNAKEIAAVMGGVLRSARA